MAVVGKSGGALLLHAKSFSQSSEKYSAHQPSPVEVILGTVMRSSLTCVKDKGRS